ncbi:MAG: PHP domain-containing protein [Dermatophilaceae bacterium]
MLIDLHAHSLASDGTDTPTQLVVEAARVGLDVLAITDHDTTDGWAEAASAAGERGIILVRGIEVSCGAASADRLASVHLLAYLPDPDDAPLVREMTLTRDSRERRAERIVEALARDVNIAYEDVLAQLEPGATVGRPHIADALVARGVVADRDEAFERYLYTGSPYYVSHYAPDAVDAVTLVLGAGGIPVLAHPFAWKRGPHLDESVIEEMAGAGLVGLEAHHPEHSGRAVARTLDLARGLGLLVTGSSDYHGAGKEQRLGARTTDPDAFAALLDRPHATPVLAP